MIVQLLQWMRALIVHHRLLNQEDPSVNVFYDMFEWALKHSDPFVFKAGVSALIDLDTSQHLFSVVRELHLLLIHVLT